MQINNRIAVKDYEEYLKIYNKPDYVSNYFEGFNTQLDKYKKLINEEYSTRSLS
ncbi:hypothetical protein KP77_28440 [Jeotgalibacillus alimentarius]|uniref:Uncharacterized protein n=1 Tax=Jeotgalibacillus alimentarius TaxID=135826 RepID=A0A0C2VCP6_9BACL|nr:hypothetical protein [Jeotgalibacillus alimentarius]KIL46717.1 hypothetical protein KP77_28440 [Jeotgalibacillus alimentarius]